MTRKEFGVELLLLHVKSSCGGSDICSRSAADMSCWEEDPLEGLWSMLSVLALEVTWKPFRPKTRHLPRSSLKNNYLPDCNEINKVVMNNHTLS